MSGESSLRTQQAVDALAYIGAVTLVLFAVSALVSFGVGGGLPGVKNMLFVLGFLAFGVAAFQLRPRAPWNKQSDTGRDETPFERLLYRALPLSGTTLPVNDRMRGSTKLFLASLLTLSISLVMEFGLGIGA
ncbi:hypothetical protein [Haladaptatus sp. DJG-WS-42]|uniref:DUF7555 family protein n=1 Tax=Haladaptatus sp. DJG-WS-42 TaxID=3120516 RepID=UPI0030CF3564